MREPNMEKEEKQPILYIFLIHIFLPLLLLFSFTFLFGLCLFPSSNTWEEAIRVPWAPCSFFLFFFHPFSLSLFTFSSLSSSVSTQPPLITLFIHIFQKLISSECCDTNIKLSNYHKYVRLFKRKASMKEVSKEDWYEVCLSST